MNAKYNNSKQVGLSLYPAPAHGPHPYFSCNQPATLPSAMIETENRPADRQEQITEPLADVNADLNQRVVVDTQRMTWESSPSGSVSRKPLYRRGGESGPVTSLVRYAPGGAFLPCIPSLETINEHVTPIVSDECNRYGEEWLKNQG